MSRYVLSPGAQADVDGIWEYSVQRWDLDQAERYLRRIKDALDVLVENPKLGRLCEGVRTGYRRCHVSSHLIFYQIQGDDIAVVRILHQSMDVEQQL